MLWLLWACRVATPVTACDQMPETCISCETDADCQWSGNSCLKTVYCAHQDASIAVIEIGCQQAMEYQWPPPENCACEAGTCRANE